MEKSKLKELERELSVIQSKLTSLAVAVDVVKREIVKELAQANLTGTSSSNIVTIDLDRTSGAV